MGSESTVEAAGRSYVVRVLPFENGAFVAVHEGSSARVGAMTVSLHSGQAPVTTPVIPAQSASPFLRLAAETVASRKRGIAAVTVSAGPEIPPEASRAILGRIMEMV